MFKDRADAGRRLAEKLREELSLENLKEIVLLAIPRGGIIVGNEIRRLLNIPLEILITKKIPSPENEELAIGAVGEDGTVVWEEELIKRLNVPVEYKQEIVKEKLLELEEKKKFFRGDKPFVKITDKIVIITDDGIATGATARSAIRVVRNGGPKEVVLAVPVIAKEILEELKERADKIVYLEAPEMFFSVGQFYENFEQISDNKVRELLT